MPMEYASRTIVAVQYNGSNGAEVLSMCQMVTQYTANVWSIAASDTSQLELREVSPAGAMALWPVTAGQWVVVAPDFGIVARVEDAKYKARYRALATIINDAVQANADVIAAKALYGGFGIAPVPALAGANAPSAVADVVVTLKPAQPDTAYVAEAFLTMGVNLLTTVVVESITKTSKSTVTVRVRNTGVAHLGGGLCMVHVTAPPVVPVVK